MRYIVTDIPDVLATVGMRVGNCTSLGRVYSLSAVLEFHSVRLQDKAGGD